MTTESDSVFILFKKTNFDTILACLWGKVYWWWGLHKFFFAKIGGIAVLSCQLLENLGHPLPKKMIARNTNQTHPHAKHYKQELTSVSCSKSE